MILEHAELSVTPGREAEFEAAFGVATTIISAVVEHYTAVLTVDPPLEENL